MEVTGGEAEREGNEWEAKTDAVTDRGKDQKWKISNFQRLIFLQNTEAVIILVPATSTRVLVISTRTRATGTSTCTRELSTCSIVLVLRP